MSLLEDLSDLGSADNAFAAAANFPIASKAVPQLPRKSKMSTPASNPAAWNTVSFNGFKAPGKWKVTGVRARNIEQPKKKGTNKNTLLDQGIAPGEVDFEAETWTLQMLRDLQDFYDKFLSPDRPLQDANVTTVAHPALHSRNIKQVYGFKATIPEPHGDRGDVKIISKFTAKVFSDLTKIGGGQGTRKPKGTPAAGGNPDSSSLQALVDLTRALPTVAAGAFGLFGGSGVPINTPDTLALLKTAGINVDVLASPIAREAVILPFEEQSALQKYTRSTPDGMVTDQATARAPR